MMNEYGAILDRNGYAPSIIQPDTESCYLCGAMCEKLDRHEPFGGGLRSKSKRLGMWVTLCHCKCHLYGDRAAHNNRSTDEILKKKTQMCAMSEYGWSYEEFIKEFGRNYL